MRKNNLKEEFGNIDIYLFDQLLKERFENCEKVIDVGCGYGRNLVYFLKNDFEVYGVDQDADAIAEVRRLSKELNPTGSIENFQVALIEEMPFEEDTFDLAICNAIFHFAKDEDHFERMLRSTWRVLKPGGFLFARLASDIGIEHLVTPIGNRRYDLPDGSTRFLVNQKMLLDLTETLYGALFEPIKTTNVENVRCMTTWCLVKL